MRKEGGGSGYFLASLMSYIPTISVLPEKNLRNREFAAGLDLRDEATPTDSPSKHPVAACDTPWPHATESARSGRSAT